ncbi:L-type lectin-domain containing receptor kinase IX.1-like [Gossypium australe]|uniref:L-type lectin-domain containing receptor kinase IX.1-like n=1 Tax=Gossypium australe TaxID=47621 RepID=A0A5B6VQC7_9ROSI|nr:L-type lectin-domain containing receptor kinase IX.1-like [Gossypium australe]
MLGNLNIKVVSEKEAGKDNLSSIRPNIPGSVWNNGTVEVIPIHLFFGIFLRAYNRSSDINDISDAATGSESPFEQDMCLEVSQDFEDGGGCNLSPNLLRMVEKDEKQILPYKESLDIVSLRGEKEVKIGACITIETKRDVIELFQKIQRCFCMIVLRDTWATKTCGHC